MSRGHKIVANFFKARGVYTNKPTTVSSYVGADAAKPAEKKPKLDAKVLNSYVGKKMAEAAVTEPPPFDKPYKKTSGTVTDKSGAKHSSMSQARDLARKGLKQMIQINPKIAEGWSNAALDQLEAVHPSIMAMAKVGSNKTLKAQADKHTEMAVAANRAGDDAKVKHHQAQVAKIKAQMQKEAVTYTGLGTDVVDKKKKLNPQPNLMMKPKQVKDFKEETIAEGNGISHALVRQPNFRGKKTWHIYDTKTRKLHSTYNNEKVAMKNYKELNDKHAGYDSPGGLVHAKNGVRQEPMRKEEVEEITEGKMKEIYTDMQDHATKKGYSSHKQFTPADYDAVGKQHGISGKELAVIAGHKTAAQVTKEENLDELNAKTLTSYADKAHQQALDATYDAAHLNRTGEEKMKADAKKLASKRAGGVQRANTKLDRKYNAAGDAYRAHMGQKMSEESADQVPAQFAHGISDVVMCTRTHRLASIISAEDDKYTVVYADGSTETGPADYWSAIRPITEGRVIEQPRGWNVKHLKPAGHGIVGKKVRSYDFPGMHDSHYIEGHVTDEDPNSYHIRTTKVVRHHKEEPIANHHMHIRAPKGISLFGGAQGVYYAPKEMKPVAKPTMRSLRGKK